MEALLQHDMHWHRDDQNPIHYNITLCLPILFLALYAQPPLSCHYVGFHSAFLKWSLWNPVCFLAAIPISHRWLASFLIFLIFWFDVAALYSPFHSRTVPVFPPYHALCNIWAKCQQQKGPPSHKHSEANVIPASGWTTAISIIVCNYGDILQFFFLSWTHEEHHRFALFLFLLCIN